MPKETGKRGPANSEARRKPSRKPKASAETASAGTTGGLPNGTDESEVDVEIVDPAEIEPELTVEVAAPAPLAKLPQGGALTQRDALRSYMAEVSKHPLLTREQELELAWRYFKDPEANVDAAYRLVTANLRLVVKLAYQYRRAAFNVLDLIQEGNIGLMQAVKKFDPAKGIKLSSYAAWWIRAYILRYIMDNFRLVKLGTTEAQRKLFFNLRKEQDKLTSQGIEAGPKLLAERLNVSEQDVQEMQGRMGNEELSLDAPLGRSDEDKRQTGLDRLPSGGAAIDDALADTEVQEQFHEKLKAFGAELTGKEKTIFDERLVAEQPLTLQEIGDKYGLTRERVRQLEAQLTRKLRAYVAKELPEFENLSFEKPE